MTRQGWWWTSKSEPLPATEPEKPKLPEGYSLGHFPPKFTYGTCIQCDSCGAAVTDMDIHDAWHGRNDK